MRRSGFFCGGNCGGGNTIFCSGLTGTARGVGDVAFPTAEAWETRGREALTPEKRNLEADARARGEGGHRRLDYVRREAASGGGTRITVHAAGGRRAFAADRQMGAAGRAAGTNRRTDRGLGDWLAAIRGFSLVGRPDLDRRRG